MSKQVEMKRGVIKNLHQMCKKEIIFFKVTRNKIKLLYCIINKKKIKQTDSRKNFIKEYNSLIVLAIENCKNLIIIMIQI